MKKMNTEKRVLEIVNRIAGHKIKHIDLEGDLQTELSLDSIQVVELFAQLEKEFGTELPLRMLTARTGKEFLGMLQKRLNEQLVCHA